MKKIMLFALVAAAASVFAGMDTAEVKVVPAVAPASITAGHSVTNSLEVSGLKGVGEVLAVFSGATTNCQVTATILSTNLVEGGWSVVNSKTVTGGAGAVRVPFQGEYLPSAIKVAIGVKNANATAGAVILSN